jgi:hypothetical protein
MVSESIRLSVRVEMTGFNDERLRMLAAELRNGLRSHPEWITQDEHLRYAATRIETERLLTPEVLRAFLVPIFRARIPPEELARLATLLDAGEVDRVTTALKAVIARYVEEGDFDPSPDSDRR